MQDQPIAHPGAEIVMLGVPRWLVDRLLPGVGLSEPTNRSICSWLNRRCPPGVRVVSSRPMSDQRRIVPPLTPSAFAAWLML
jgi:hypothetical protein